MIFLQLPAWPLHFSQHLQQVEDGASFKKAQDSARAGGRLTDQRLLVSFSEGSDEDAAANYKRLRNEF